MTPTSIYQTCPMCKGSKKALRAGKEIDPCPLCDGEGIVNTLELDEDDTKDKITDILDRCGDIMDKCNDIFEKLNE